MKSLNRRLLACSISALLCTTGLSSDLKQENETTTIHQTVTAQEFQVLNELPSEIQLKVFSFVRPQDIISLNLTARSLNEITKDNKLWFNCLKSINIISVDEKYNAEENYYSYHILNKRPLIRVITDDALHTKNNHAETIYFDNKGTYITVTGEYSNFVHLRSPEEYIPTKAIVKKRNLLTDKIKSCELTLREQYDIISVVGANANMDIIIGSGTSLHTVTGSLVKRYPVVWRATNNYKSEAIHDLIKSSSHDLHSVSYKTVDAISPNGLFIAGTALINEIIKLFILDINDQSMHLLNIDPQQGLKSISLKPFNELFENKLNSAKLYIDDQANINGRSLMQLNSENSNNLNIQGVYECFFSNIVNNKVTSKISIRDVVPIRDIFKIWETKTIPSLMHLSEVDSEQKRSTIHSALPHISMVIIINSANLNSSFTYGNIIVDGSKITPYIAILPKQVNNF